MNNKYYSLKDQKAMKKFLLMFQSPPSAMEEMMKATPEQQAAIMKPWMEWKNLMGDKIVDLGSPLQGSKLLKSNGTETSEQSKTDGFTIIQAKDFDEVKSLLKTHPNLMKKEESGIEIFEFCGM